MKKIYSGLLVAFTTISFAQTTNVGITGNVAGVYINEFHYDNTGADVGEFVEVAGPAGTDLSTYKITLYNGFDNTSYQTISLSGIIDDEGTGVGAVKFDAIGIQNGEPDALALSKTGNTNIQYLSYEGVMSGPALDGPAAGLTAVDILATEISAPVGGSLEYDEASMAWVIITDDTPDIFAQGTVLSVKQNVIDGLKVYPNPVANGNLYITSDNNTSKTVVVYDVLGKQVIKTTITDQPVNVSALKGGVYIVKITEEGKTATRKLVIR